MGCGIQGLLTDSLVSRVAIFSPICQGWFQIVQQISNAGDTKTNNETTKRDEKLSEQICLFIEWFQIDYKRHRSGHLIVLMHFYVKFAV